MMGAVIAAIITAVARVVFSLWQAATAAMVGHT